MLVTMEERPRNCSGRYILDEQGKPVPEPSLLKWGEWMQNADRILMSDELPGNVRVSTVFLGLDHNFEEGPPILWETMIFGGPQDGYQNRYPTKETAVQGHHHAVQIASLVETETGEVK